MNLPDKYEQFLTELAVLSKKHEIKIELLVAHKMSESHKESKAIIMTGRTVGFSFKD